MASKQSLINQRFGRLVVIEMAEKLKPGQYRWLCQCDCGEQIVVDSQRLKKGNTKSCGCYRKDVLRQRVTKDRVGCRYDLLVVLEKDKNRNWKCICDCGVQVIRSSTYLNKAKKKHCGCQDAKSVYKLKAYKSWQSMKKRCFNPKEDSYVYYGGRGITICERWLKFSNFLEDMGDCPPNHSIDRIDVNGNYEPGNCRWATNDQQANNRTDNVFITYEGKTLTAAQWAQELGMSDALLRSRLAKGCSFEEAINPESLYRKIEFQGESKTMSEWAETLNISRTLLNYRLRAGWSVEKAFSTPAKPGYGRPKKTEGEETLLIEYQGEIKTVNQWAKIMGLRPGTLGNRIKRGWDLDRAMLSPVN